jgi:hypothetical protein
MAGELGRGSLYGAHHFGASTFCVCGKGRAVWFHPRMCDVAEVAGQASFKQGHSRITRASKHSAAATAASPVQGPHGEVVCVALGADAGALGRGQRAVPVAVGRRHDDRGAVGHGGRARPRGGGLGWRGPGAGRLGESGGGRRPCCRNGALTRGGPGPGGWFAWQVFLSWVPRSKAQGPRKGSPRGGLQGERKGRPSRRTHRLQCGTA